MLFFILAFTLVLRNTDDILIPDPLREIKSFSGKFGRLLCVIGREFHNKFSFKFFIYLVILLLAVLGLHCCEWGLLFIDVCGLFHCGGFSCCGSRALERRLSCCDT